MGGDDCEVRTDEGKLKIPESEVIPNGVDTGLFVPVSRVTAKEHIGFPVSRKMVLFGSSA